MLNEKDCLLFQPRFCSRLVLEQSNLVRKTAMQIAERAKEICDIQGRKPSSIAGASIYLACLALNENITRKGNKKNNLRIDLIRLFFL